MHATNDACYDRGRDTLWLESFLNCRAPLAKSSDFHYFLEMFFILYYIGYGISSEIAQSFFHNSFFWERYVALKYLRKKRVCLYRSVMRLSLGKLLANLLQVVKRTITPLTP